MPRLIQIAPQQEGKGRTFQALCLATVQADPFWPGGETTTDDIRPVWAMFAGSENQIRPFATNLLLGRKAEFPEVRHGAGKRMQLLRSAGYQLVYQREAEGTIVTAMLPELFRLDPGMVDPDGAKFIVLPTRDWYAAQTVDTRPLVEHALKLDKLPAEVDEGALTVLSTVSFLFAAYLDRRTGCPLLSDGRFYLQLLIACLSQGLASWSNAEKRYYSYDKTEFGKHQHLGFFEQCTSDVGLLPGIAFKATHKEIEEVLAKEVSLFFQMTGAANG